MSGKLEPVEKGSWRWAAALLLAAIGVGYWLFKTGPETETKEEPRPPKIVKTVSPPLSAHRISVEAYGTVIPARQIVVKPQVGGQILNHHPNLTPGGFLMEEEKLLEIDPSLLRLSVRETSAAEARAEALLKEAERKREEALRLAQERVIANTELASLESQAKAQSAELRRLRAIREREEEMLRRHVLRAPFNAIVLEEAVEIGQHVDPGFAAATLVGADEFWVRVSLPMEKLRWIRLPKKKGERKEGQEGARAEVYLEMGGERTVHRSGRVVRLLVDLQPEGRMARLLVRIPDPMGLDGRADGPPLLLGSYVRVEIDAGELKDVIEAPREVLKEGEQVWISDSNNELQIRAAQVLWRSGEVVYLNNILESGESIIVSPLRTALPGMKINPQPTGFEEPLDAVDK